MAQMKHHIKTVCRDEQRDFPCFKSVPNDLRTQFCRKPGGANVDKPCPLIVGQLRKSEFT